MNVTVRLSWMVMTVAGAGGTALASGGGGAGRQAARRGRLVIRRWTFLVVPASNEDEAQELAGQIRREAPADATVRAGHAPGYVPFMGW